MIHNKDSITMVFIGNLINTIDCWVMMRKTMHCNDEDVMMSKTATTWWQSFKKKRRSLTRTPLELSQLQPGLIVQLPIPYVSLIATQWHTVAHIITHIILHSGRHQHTAHCTQSGTLHKLSQCYPVYELAQYCCDSWKEWAEWCIVDTVHLVHSWTTQWCIVGTVHLVHSWTTPESNILQSPSMFLTFVYCMAAGWWWLFTE